MQSHFRRALLEASGSGLVFQLIQTSTFWYLVFILLSDWWQFWLSFQDSRPETSAASTTSFWLQNATVHHLWCVAYSSKRLKYMRLCHLAIEWFLNPREITREILGKMVVSKYNAVFFWLGPMWIWSWCECGFGFPQLWWPVKNYGCMLLSDMHMPKKCYPQFAMD